MAINPTALTIGNSATAGFSWNTASVSPGANKLLLLAVASGQQSTALAAVNHAASGNGLTWEAVERRGFWSAGGGLFWGHISLLRAMGPSPSSGAITITHPGTSGQQADSICWSLVEFSGVNTSGTNGSGAIVQALDNAAEDLLTTTVTLAAFSSTNNATYGCFAGFNSGGATETISPGSGFTEIHEQAMPYLVLGAQWRATNDTTVEMTKSGTASGSYIGGIAVELRAANLSPPSRQNYQPFLMR